jgi:hypothetical protein
MNTDTPQVEQWLKDLAEAKYPFPKCYSGASDEYFIHLVEKNNAKQSAFISGVQWAMAKEWIDVKEKLPEGNGQILFSWINENKKRRTSLGFYAAKHSVEYYDDETSSDYADYSEEKDEYYYPEGFHESPVDIPYSSKISGVTHWQPLPSPPDKAAYIG